MFGRNLGRFLLVLVLVVGVFALAGVAYQVGINVAATQLAAPAAGGAATTPVVVPYYGYGHPFGFGFGIFGFLFFLLFLFLIVGLIRAVAFGGRGRGWGGAGRHGGWNGGMGGPGSTTGDHGEHFRNSAWGQRAHEVFEGWHREAHGDTPPPSSTPGASDRNLTGQA